MDHSTVIPLRSDNMMGNLSQSNDFNLMNLVSSLSDHTSVTSSTSDRPSPVATSNPAGNNQTTVLDIDENDDHEHSHDEDSTDSLRNSNFVAHLQTAIPFIILALAKFLYNHRLGLAVVTILTYTFGFTNSCMERATVELDSVRWSQAVKTLLLSNCAILVNISAIYFFFSNEILYRSLLFMPVAVKVDLCGLMWAVLITDFMVKFITVFSKSLITLVPEKIMGFRRKRGKYYYVLEKCSQFYRAAVTCLPWMYFLLNEEYGGYMFSFLLLIIYCFLKGMNLWRKIVELRKVFTVILQDSGFGLAASVDDLKKQSTCPICFENFTNPIKTLCSHVFCDCCLSQWLSRESSCPVCRAILTEKPLWREGATSAHLQLY